MRRFAFSTAGILGAYAAYIIFFAQTIITVCANGCTFPNNNLQGAINSAVGGDTILLQADFEYVGDFVLRANTTSSYITMKTGVDANGNVLAASLFPSAGTRVNPTTHSNFAIIKPSSNNAAGFQTVEPGDVGSRCASAPCLANYWRLQYLEFANNSYAGDQLLKIGTNDTVGSSVNGDMQDLRSEIPHHFELLHLYVHGDPIIGQNRGISIFANNVVIKDSYIDEIKALTEGQGIYFNNSEGPYTVENTFIRAHTENVIFGGDKPRVATTTTVSATTSTTITLASVQDLQVGQGLTCLIGGNPQAREVSAINGSVVTITPAWVGTVDTPGSCNWGVVPKNLTFTKNHLTKSPSWRNSILSTPQSVSAIASGSAGTLAAGTYYYKVVARKTVANGGTANSAASAEVNATVGANGAVTVSWNAVTNAENYRVYGRTAGGQNIYFTTSSTSFTDTGAAGTSGLVSAINSSEWLIKNNFELKNLDTATIEGNVFEYSWQDGQGGPLILFTAANSTNGNDSTTVRNITFRYNWVAHGAQAMQITGHDHSSNNQESQRTVNLNIHDNVFYDIGNAWGASTSMILITSPGHSLFTPRDGPRDVQIVNNTFVNSGSRHAIHIDLGRSSIDYTIENFTVRSNFWRRGTYGVKYVKSPGGDQAEGTTSLNLGVRGTNIFTHNVMQGASCGIYPANNFCPDESTFQGAFTSYSTQDFSVPDSSVYNNAGHDGTDIGADIGQINTFKTIALSGNNTGGGSDPPPSPPSITTTTLPSGQTGQIYNGVSAGFCLVATGGLQPYVWTQLNAGTNPLPTGLSLVSGCVTGTPTQGGSFLVTFRATDGNSLQAQRDFTLNITEIIFPEPRPDFVANYQMRASWAFETCPTEGYQFKIGDKCFDLTEGSWKYISETSPAVTWSLLSGGGIAPKPTVVMASDVTSANVPVGGAELGQVRMHRLRIDTESYTQVALMFGVINNCAGTTPVLRIEYWDGAAWQTVGISGPCDSGANTLYEGNFTTLPVGARNQNQIFRGWITTGDGVVDPRLGNVQLQFRQ